MADRIVRMILLSSITCVFIVDCHATGEEDKQMELGKLLEYVNNDCIQFLTMRPEGSEFSTLERRVVVTNPPQLVKLSLSGEPLAVDALVKMLKEKKRAWAAIVILAAMTRRDEKIVETFSTMPDEWWSSPGVTAYDRWSAWLNEARGRLVWDKKDNIFIVKK